ncbi:hypothetical protein TTHERM_00693270 (macronuclear) [Tetrahymena thermophila SB210]|uniref:Uncharacterized protein n=1 Tax=Tetrahymena thermophila (strain SB210) TaxID=312017 RepID=Q244Z0_TETTS|nr:hypothetical protein TTHERM_00693270 [Tetrahymena thermophila SB210]EAS03347.1 hypothetical protein TTHERM_00693270 [Tetrahymena thermophila SB210]|eukprot:XP_001023592.1 hypothetical protein TTHERM_00693270 [Tetrahymena thermophila SB210]
MERLLAPLDSFLMNYSINKQIEEQKLISTQNKQINQKSQQFISSNPKSQHAINQSCRTINDLNIKLGQIINQQNSQMLNSSICTISSLNTNHGEHNSFGNLSKFLQFCNQKPVQNNKRKVSAKQQDNQTYQLQSIQVSLPAQSQNLQMNQPHQPKNFQGGILENLQEKAKNTLPTKQISSKQLNNSTNQNTQNLAQLNTQNVIQQNIQNFSNSNQSKNNSTAQTKSNQISSVNQLQNNQQNIQNRPPSHTFHNAPNTSELDTKSKVIQQKIQEQINLKKDILINKLITSQKNYSKTPEQQHLINNQPVSQLLLDQDQLNIGSSTDRNLQHGSQSQKLTLELKRNKSQQLEQMKKLNSSKTNSISKQQEKELLKKLFVSKQKQSNIFQSQNNDILNTFNGQLSPTHSQPLFQNQSPNIILNNSHNDINQQLQQNKNQKTEAAFKHPNIPKLNLASTVLLQQEQIPNKLITQNSQLHGKLTPQNQTKLQGKRSDSVQQSGTYGQQQLHNNNNNPLYTTRNNKQEDIKIQQYSPSQKPQYARSTSPQNKFENRIINNYQKKIYDNPSLQIMNSERLHASRNQSKNVSPQCSPVGSHSQLLANPILQKQLIYSQELNIAKTQATKSHEGTEELKNLYFQLQKKQQQLGLCGLDSNKENSKIHKAIMNSRDIIDSTGQQSPQAFNGPTTYILKGRHKSYHNHLTYSNQQVSGNQLIQSSQLNSGSPSSINCKASPYIKSVGISHGIQNNNCTSSSNGLGKNSTGITGNGTGVSKIASLSNRTSFMPNSRDNSNLKMSHNESSRNNNDLQPNNSALLNIVNENQQNNNKQNEGLISTLLSNNLAEDRTIPKKLNLNLTLLQQRNSCSNDQQPLLSSNRQLEEKKRADTSRLNKQNSSSNIGGSTNSNSNKVAQNNTKQGQNVNKKMQKSYSTHHSRNNSTKGIDGLAKNQYQFQQKSNQSILSRVNSSKQYTLQNNNAATILMTEYNGKNHQENIILNSNIILNNLISNSSQAYPSGLRGSTVVSNINTNPNFNYTGGTLNTDINIIQPTEINNYEYLINNQKNNNQAQNPVAGFLTDRTHYAQNVKKNSQVQQQIQMYQQQQLKQNTKSQINKMSEIQTNFNKPHKKSSQYEQYLQQQINELRNNTNKLNYKSTNQLTTQGHTKTKSDVSAVQYTGNLNTNVFWNQTKGTMNTRITEMNNSGIGQQIFPKNNQYQNIQQQYLQTQNDQQLYLQQTDRPGYNQVSQYQKEMIINEQKQNGSSTARVQSAQGHNNNSGNNINKKISNANGSKTPTVIQNYSNNNLNQNFNPYTKVLMNNYAGNNQMIQQSDLQQQNFSKKQQFSPVIRYQQSQNGYIQDQILTNIQMRDQKQFNLNQNSQKQTKQL